MASAAKTQLNLNGRIFLISELAEIDSEIGKTDFEKSTLSFCRQWLSEEKKFSLHTSGSTGTPKEIILSRSQMEASARLTIEALHLTSGINSLVCLDTKYIAGKMMLVRSLINGMNIIAVEPEANPFSKCKDKIDFAAFVPYQVETILNESKEQLDQVECAIVGGAAVSIGLQQKTQSTTCQLFATYGMTETISHIALQKLNGENTSDFFTTQPSVKIHLDERGCLVITADYLGNEPIITNDLVEILSPTAFRWLGRIDHVINSGGIKVTPEKVEKVFEKIFYEKEIRNRFFVSNVSDQKLGQQIVLVVESASFEKTIQHEVLQAATHALHKYEIPRQILFTDSFAETATGKINRNETMKRFS